MEILLSIFSKLKTHFIGKGDFSNKVFYFCHLIKT
jgi:hypothetical protein